jgi:hypothetical protein
MATRVLRTPSVLLVNDALDEREMYARTLRAVGYRGLRIPLLPAKSQLRIDRMWS